MSEYKVGDRFKLVGEEWGDAEPGFGVGDVVEADRIDADGDPQWGEWSLLAFGGQIEGWETELVARADESDPVNAPSHYLFPGGVEVIHLTRHLTSNGGQAVQYIARSTRLDGQNKGAQVEDLRKAIRLINDEIERVERT